MGWSCGWDGDDKKLIQNFSTEVSMDTFIWKTEKEILSEINCGDGKWMEIAEARVP
jgi:hypothetical protein